MLVLLSLAVLRYVYALYGNIQQLCIGHLSVVAVQARNLPAADVSGTSDPYCIITLTGRSLHSNSHTSSNQQSESPPPLGWGPFRCIQGL